MKPFTKLIKNTKLYNTLHNSTTSYKTLQTYRRRQHFTHRSTQQLHCTHMGKRSNLRPCTLGPVGDGRTRFNNLLQSRVCECGPRRGSRAASQGLARMHKPQQAQTHRTWQHEAVGVDLQVVMIGLSMGSHLTFVGSRTRRATQPRSWLWRGSDADALPDLGQQVIVLCTCRTRDAPRARP